MFALLTLAYYIVTVYSQCNQYYGVSTGEACDTATTSSCTPPSPATPYHCDESSLGQGNDCVDHADICAACASLCTYSYYSGFQPSQISPDEIYSSFKCNTGICTAAPTTAPIKPDTPTRAPVPAPTFECDAFTCNPSAAPNTNCGGEPAEAYACTPKIGDGTCTEETTLCGACCRADALIFLQQTRQDAFDTSCKLNNVCPTAAPTRNPVPPGSPTGTPTDAPTTVCSQYTCNPASPPDTNCGGQPNVPYSCTPLITQTCGDESSLCSACCMADTLIILQQTRQDAFDLQCTQDACPTPDPSKAPSNDPSMTPSKSPSSDPSASPSESPSKYPTQTPTQRPTRAPLRLGETHGPSQPPTKYPTDTPSQTPSKTPSKSPSETPSKTPSNDPSVSPSKSPSKTPSATPSSSPEHPAQSPVAEQPSQGPAADSTERKDTDGIGRINIIIPMVVVMIIFIVIN